MKFRIEPYASKIVLYRMSDDGRHVLGSVGTYDNVEEGKKAAQIYKDFADDYEKSCVMFEL